MFFLAFTVVFCGPAGSGNREPFPLLDHCQAEVVTILGRRIQLINAPKIFEFEGKHLIQEFSRVSTFARNGIHAVAFVLNLKKGLSSLQQNAISQFLQCKGLQPFTFILWTNAEGTDVSSTDFKHYIQQHLLANPICRDGVKHLVKFVGFRAIMVKSRGQIYTVRNEDNKAKEFIEMVEMISRNGCKKYTNSYLHCAATAYKDAQKYKVQQLNKVLKSHHDKIQQLQIQLTAKKLHSSSLLDSKRDTRKERDKERVNIENEIKVLELQRKLAYKRVVDTINPQEITIDRVHVNMVTNTYTTVKLGAAGLAATIGGGVGAIVGSVVPGLGTMYGAVAGASVFATWIGRAGPSHCDDCKIQ